MSMADSHSPTPTAQTADMRQRWNARYAEGVTPWDTRITPPEVVDFWAEDRLPRQGIALDLGCGPATNVRFLAQLGLTAYGIEIADAPLQQALQRYKDDPPALKARMHLICADVTALPFTDRNACYMLDVGCLHSLPVGVRQAYAAGVCANLAPGGYYQLYAFDQPPPGEEPAYGPVGLAEGELADLFGSAMVLVEEIIAQPDRRPCRWYLWQRC